MQVMQTLADHPKRHNRNLEAESKFCRSTLAQVNSLAMQEQLALATRDVSLVKGAAESVHGLQSKLKNPEGIDRLAIQLAEVQRGLNDFRSFLKSRPGAH